MTWTLPLVSALPACAALQPDIVAAAFPGLAALPRSVYGILTIVLLSAILWLAARKTRWSAAAGWFALALAGQVCALELVEAGPVIRLQLFFGWSDLLHSWRGIFLLTLAAQGAVVLWGARRLWPAAQQFLPRLISKPQWLALIVLSVYAAVTIAPGVAQALFYQGLFSAAFAKQLLVQASKVALGLAIFSVGGLNLILAAAALPECACFAAREPRAERRWLPWAAALWVVVVASLLAVSVMDRMPHVPDEISYYFHAKYLATGHLTLASPPAPKVFNGPFHWDEGGRWYMTPPAGWPFVLALGFLIGAPWLVNPLLGGIAVLLAHAWVRRMYDRGAADAVALLLAASPWFLLMSASLMTHPTTLVFALGGLLGTWHARERGSVSGAAAAGLCIGALLHVRPLDAVIIALVAGVWWLAGGWKKLRVVALMSTVVAGAVMTLLFFAYNRAITGNAFAVPINRGIDQSLFRGANRLGFGRDIGNFGWTGIDALPGHGPLDVVMNTNHNLYMLNFDLFGWACGSLALVFLLLVWRRWRSDALMWGVPLAVVAGMSLYWYSGVPDFGARYWYPLLVPIVALTVRGAQGLAARLRRLGASPGAVRGVWVFVALASLAGLVNQVTWRSLDKYHNFRGPRADIRELDRQYHFGRSLVLIRGEWWPDYTQAFPFNPPQFDRDAPGPLYAHDLNPEATRRTVEYYSDRPVWVIAGASRTGDVSRVVAGPLPSGQVPPR